MPPANQGSRTALVTWTVVTSFLFVVATIFAIYYYVNGSALAKENDTIKQKYHEMIAEGALASQDVEAMRELRNKPENGYNPNESLWDVSMQRGEKLKNAIAGAASPSPETALSAADLALKDATARTKAVGFNLQADNLVNALNLLRDGVVQRSTDAANARKQADEAVADAAKRRKDADDQIARLTEDLEKKQGELEQAKKDFEGISQTQEAGLQQTAAGTTQKLKDVQDQLDKSNQQVQELSKQLDTANKEKAQAQQKLQEIRPDVNRPQTSQVDGKIVRLPGSGICYIDLGRSDQIFPGMTFEVYDRTEGIPPIGDPNAVPELALPKGKGSIEVTHVGATSSEARIVQTTPGTALTEGDAIANLIYDRNTKNKFLVYGNFDLAHTAKPNPQDGEVIKRLITQWGGEVMPEINVDTDFVVLGAEPQIPTLTKEQREDPVEKAIYDKAVADAEAYNNISSKARDYRIPILNQNRFLYMIGYYELSRR